MIEIAQTLAPFALTAIPALCILIVLRNERTRQLSAQDARKSFGQWPEEEQTLSPRSPSACVQILPDNAARRLAPGPADALPPGGAIFPKMTKVSGGPS
ncbi:MAG: hypothetical protein ABJL55_16495 [Roseibium sp.]